MGRNAIFTFTPRPEQDAAVRHAVQSLREGIARTLYSSPTGTGKSYVELAVQDDEPDGTWIVSPVVEVIDGLLRKRGVDTDALSQASFNDAADAHHISTPITLRNRLLRGESLRITRLIIDEAHHSEAETYQQLDLLASVPQVGYTATPFRGTPRGTKALLDYWGEPQPILTYREAVQLGRLSHPTCRVVPLVDDDVCTVANGEFTVSSIDAATHDKLQGVVELCVPWFLHSRALWDRPTMFAAPSRETALVLAERLNSAGLPAVAVTQETSWRARREAFAAVVDCRAALVQVRVVGEGVDLPMRRLVDLTPCLSPVRWQQVFGRITRPVNATAPIESQQGGESQQAPEYVCCNRNLLRHAYLLEGMVPASTIADAQRAFGGPGQRPATRAVGLESLGRLKPIELPFANGVTGTCYVCAAVQSDGKAREYAVIVHPCRPDPLWATRCNTPRADGTRSYGRWQKCVAPADLAGFASLPVTEPSEKQVAWWKRDAKRWGLDAEAKVTRKNFTALPVLCDLRYRGFAA